MKLFEIIGIAYVSVSALLFVAFLYWGYKKREKAKKEMMYQHGKPRGQFE